MVLDSLDVSSLGVLLQELSVGLPQEITALLQQKDLENETLQYLNDISSIESKEYLSSIPPAPSVDYQTVDRTLVQDIAELEAKQRQLDLNLKDLIITSHNTIIDNKLQLNQADKLFKEDFTDQSKELWRTFNEDKLENLDQEDDTQLRELEVDLQYDDNDDNNDNDKKNKNIDSFRSIVGKIKQLEQETASKNLSIVLENIDQILNILEVPSITAACIKAGYYSEALEIASYTRRLAIRFPNNDLINAAEAGIKNEMGYMLTGLIRLLTTNLKQSSIIKTLSYLRRVPPFSQVDDSDGQLKTILLHSRYQFIKSELDSLIHLKDNELYDKYLKRSIEVIREHCFSSVMTYKNVFPDEDEDDLGVVFIELDELDEEIEKLNKGVEEEKLEEEKPVEVIPKDLESNPDTSKEIIENEVTSQDEKNKEDTIVTISDRGEDQSKKAQTTGNETNTPLIIASSERKPSNLLLFEFIETILQDLLKILRFSLPKIKETSTRDGLYLQLIYCAQSLARIDENFGDLMTVLLLSSKGDDFLIDRKTWISLLSKQRQLSQSLNR